MQERSIDWLPPLSALTVDHIHLDLGSGIKGMCPHQELSPQLFSYWMMHQHTEAHWPGHKPILYSKPGSLLFAEYKK